MRIFKANEIDDQRFYKIPKSLFGNENYIGLSLEAKTVYAFLRDRMELSRSNNWITEIGEIYLLFTRENIAELLEISLPTVTKVFKQLVRYKLIMEKRQGLGRPNVIFVCHIEKSQENQQKQSFLMSGHKESLHQDTKNICPNDTELSKTESSKTDDNNNGAFSNEERTPSLSFRTEINKARIFFAKCYQRAYGEKYHKHKPEQNKEIDERLNAAFSEFYLGIDNMEDMIAAYFNKVNCDHNLMHFTTENILRNRMYEEAY